MIYFASFVSIEDSPIRIGFSDNVDLRIKQHEASYKTPMALLAVLPGDRDEERRIHDRFSHLRLGKTEQFRPAAELMAFIGRPLLVGANPDAVEVIPFRNKPVIATIRGSLEFKAWIEKAAKKDRTSVADFIERAIVRYARELGIQEEPPER